MQQTAVRNDGFMLDSPVGAGMAQTRLALGLLQGIVLYFLYHAAKTHTWPATADHVFAPLLLISALAPIILISSLGHLQKKQAVIWTCAVVIMVGLLAFYDIWRSTGNDWYNRSNQNEARFPSPLLVIFTTAGLYIAQALVLAGAADKRRIASYTTYFEAAWKLFIQIKFSALFVGALWLVLWLGATLFMLVKLDFLKELLQQSWFVIPVTAFAYACAIHITDVRPAIVRGIRTLLLVLMSWILPVTTLLVAGFLLSLPWTGLEPLWATKHATAVLLGTAAVLVVLINAAFQNGAVGDSVARVIRFSARIAALALLPMIVIGIYSLGLRVADYGWTTDRVIAAACLLVAGCYAAGYAWAAAQRGAWLASIASVNVATAFVVLAVLLGLFSPLADPARLSVNSQMARFASGKVSADKFDFDYLRFEGARYGLAALEQLKTRTQGADAALVRQKVELTMQKTHKWSKPDEPALKSAELAANVQVWPKSAHLPAAFLKQDWKAGNFRWQLPRCLTQQGSACDAYLIDFSGDGKPEVLMVGQERHTGAALLVEGSDGNWQIAGALPRDFAGCAALRQQLQAQSYRLVAPRLQDLEVAGQRIELTEKNMADSLNCDSLGKGNSGKKGN